MARQRVTRRTQQKDLVDAHRARQVSVTSGVDAAA